MKEKIKLAISQVEDGMIDSFEENNTDVAPGTIQEILEQMGFESQDDINTNGWQVDYWETWEKNGVEYRLSGCAWYGDFSFSKI